MVQIQIYGALIILALEHGLLELKELMDRCASAKIFIEDTAWPGTVIQIDAQQMVIDNEEKRRVEFFIKDGREMTMRGVTNYV